MSVCLSVCQILLSEVNDYGEVKNSVENTAHRLTEMSRKEDCDVIHNLIMAVQDRYKKLQQHVAERGRMLEEVKKSSRQAWVVFFFCTLKAHFQNLLITAY